MVIPGKVANGVVLIEGGPMLPEGADVSISYPPVAVASETWMKPSSGAGKKRVHLPLVPSSAPGTRRLTAEDVAEILDQEDVCAGH